MIHVAITIQCLMSDGKCDICCEQAADKVEQLLQASSMQLRQTTRKGEDKRGVSDSCLSREGSGKSGRESR